MVNFVTVALALSVLTNCGGHSSADRQAPRLLVESYLRTDHGECQPMKPGLARECGLRFGYNSTRMPNLLNFRKQGDALLQFRGFEPLLRSHCSSELRMLLCLFYFPSCSAGGPGEVLMVTPCRPVCERVRAACLPALKRFRVDWPEPLHCERLMTEPMYVGPSGERIVCVNRPGNATLKPTPPQTESTLVPTTVTPTSTTQCRPRKCKMTKVKKKTFKRRRFHWVVAAVLKGTNFTERGSKVFFLNVTKTFLDPLSRDRPHRQNRRHVIEVHTDTSDVCACPHLQPRHVYLLAGHVTRGRLMLTAKRGLVAPFKKRYQKKIPLWLKRRSLSGHDNVDANKTSKRRP